MNSGSFRFRLAISAFAFLVCTFLTYLFIPDKPARLVDTSTFPKGHVHPPPFPPKASASSGLHKLGVASQVYVLSLPRRHDRRLTMDALSHALDFEFVYVDGVEATDASIDRVVRVLRMERYTFRQNSFKKTMVDPNALHVPEYEYIAGEGWRTGASEGLDSMGSADDALSLSSFTSLEAHAPVSSDMAFEYEETLDLPCATPEDPFPVPLNATELQLLPPWRVLSRGMVACWIGHLNIIRQIHKLQLEVAVVLEDDVDMEYDVSRRLTDMWPALPPGGWDIVMLGMFT